MHLHSAAAGQTAAEVCGHISPKASIKCVEWFPQESLLSCKILRNVKVTGIIKVSPT